MTTQTSRKDRKTRLHRTGTGSLPAGLQEEAFVPLLDCISDLVTVIDDDARIQFENQSVEDVLGYRPGQLIGERAFDYVHPDDRSRVKDRFIEAIDSAEPTTERIEYRFKHTNGSWVWLESVGSNQLSDLVAGYVVVSRDVSDQLGRTAQLEAFTRTVSHDLRNPLSVAMLELALAKQELETDASTDAETDEETTVENDHLERVEASLARMQTLVDELLKNTHEGTNVLELKPVSLHDVVSACWEQVETGSASLVCDSDVQFGADEGRLARLVENLLRNAIEHGGPDVTVHVGKFEDGFYVEDDGRGFDSTDLSQLFEPGFSNAGGTGYGLAIVSDIVRAHGWDIRAVGDEEFGARFEITGVDIV